MILTTGGQSYPGRGTTGDGYRFAAQFGHRIVPPRPALVPLTIGAAWVARAARRHAARRRASVSSDGASSRCVQRRGSLLFAHFGLSGPVILDVSRVVSGHPSRADACRRDRFSAAMAVPELDEWLRDESLAAGKKQLAVVARPAVLPRRLAEIALERLALPTDRKAAGPRQATSATGSVDAIKRLRVPITGTLGFKKAEVTAGGVALDEVDSRTMESKLVPGLFLAGEVLDLDGPIGGYNFQAAWSTGWLAGSSV